MLECMPTMLKIFQWWQEKWKVWSGAHIELEFWLYKSEKCIVNKSCNLTTKGFASFALKLKYKSFFIFRIRNTNTFQSLLSIFIKCNIGIMSIFFFFIKIYIRFFIIYVIFRMVIMKIIILFIITVLWISIY